MKEVSSQPPFDNSTTGPAAENLETILRLENAVLQRRTWSDIIADSIADFTGSILFVVFHLAWFALWAAWNTGFLTSGQTFDPYPFPLLTMLVSMEGVLLVTFVLIKQNRMGYLTDRRAHLDLQINLLAERETTQVLRLLNQVANQLQVKDALPKNELTEDTRIEGLVQAIDQKLNENC
jgi:uncharacterized membrane protein